MKLIVGLGNPGTNYAGTRHNIGFTVLNEFAAANNVSFKPSTKFKGIIAELTVEDDKILLLKPTTFYNLSGDSVWAVADFYKINASDILVVHDELALPFGTIRSRLSGSDAGNNGVKSVTAVLGQNYPRIRVGIYNELRDKIDDADFVLSKFSKDEAEKLNPEVIKKTIQSIEAFISGNFTIETHKV